MTIPGYKAAGNAIISGVSMCCFKYWGLFLGAEENGHWEARAASAPARVGQTERSLVYPQTAVPYACSQGRQEPFKGEDRTRPWSHDSEISHILLPSVAWSGTGQSLRCGSLCLSETFSVWERLYPTHSIEDMGEAPKQLLLLEVKCTDRSGDGMVLES